ncbi:PepSY-associated TM helix domain-containing protein [Pseudomaricurvus sp.]|uniref:PepSY-associated TM helix domain-containing protein n=1 Tax=Pseudomaricurvus sp. TaxID=2004510 RepID=UPI003F6A74A5
MLSVEKCQEGRAANADSATEQPAGKHPRDKHSINKNNRNNNSSDTKKTKPKSKKRKLFDLHSWVGFQLMLIMGIVLLTGTIAVISNEIDWLLQEDMRVTPDGDKVSWAQMETAIHQAAPNHKLTSFGQGENDYFAYRARLSRPDGSYYYLHINQWTGELTGTSPSLTVQRFFRDLHRYLFMPKVVGLPIVGAMAIALLISLYTGLKTAGRLRTVAFRIRTHKGLRIATGDAHRAVGVWAIWFIVLIAVTGIWYLAEFGGQLAGKPFDPPRLGLPQQLLNQRTDIGEMITAETIIANTTQALPNWEPSRILYPENLTRPIIVFGHGSDRLVRPRANRVSLDPVTGTVIQIVRSDTSGWLAYLNDLADPLHFGSFGGLITKIIWFVFGLGLTGLTFTGVWLTYRRLNTCAMSRAQLLTTPVLLATVVAGYFYIDKHTNHTSNHNGEYNSNQTQSSLMPQPAVTSNPLLFTNSR